MRMQSYCLEIDLGVSKGRHVLSYLECGKRITEEIYCFPNYCKEHNGEMIWDVKYLFSEVLEGMKKCKTLGKIPVAVGVSTWDFDFAMIDMKGRRLGNVVAYCDHRTQGMEEKVHKRISEDELFERTGIQTQSANTLYQLMALKYREPEILVQADYMLLLPDYFHYLLTGKAVTGYNGAVATQLTNALTKDWDMDLILKLGYPTSIFTEIVMPGENLGRIKPAIAVEIGYTCEVVIPEKKE